MVGYCPLRSQGPIIRCAHCGLSWHHEADKPPCRYDDQGALETVSWISRIVFWPSVVVLILGAGILVAYLTTSAINIVHGVG